MFNLSIIREKRKKSEVKLKSLKSRDSELNLFVLKPQINSKSFLIQLLLRHSIKVSPFLFQFKDALKAFEDELDKIQVNAQQGLTKQPPFVFELLEKCGLTTNNKNHFFEILQRILQYFGAQPSNPRHHNGASLAKFNDFLQVVFSESPGSAEMPVHLKKRAGGRVSNCYKVKQLDAWFLNLFRIKMSPTKLGGFFRIHFKSHKGYYFTAYEKL